MAERIRYITRPATRQYAILQEIRARILSGAYPIGSRLPTHRELEQTFRAGRKTIEAVLGRLADDGFVVTRGRAGTFVSDTPPHCSRYALVFPCHPDSEYWSQFHTALYQEARAFDTTRHRCIVPFFSGGTAGAGSYPELIDEIQDHRLAGVIMAPGNGVNLDTAITDNADLPIVRISGSGPATVIVDLDYTSFIEHALKYFLSRGRRHIAVIALQSSFAWVEQKMQLRIAEHGIVCPRRWVQSIGMVNTGWMLNCLEMLLYPGQDVRPDGLILLDDNMVPEAAHAMRAMGIAVPDDLEVVAHANFPWPTQSALSFCRLGFDTRQVLDTCLTHIDRHRRGVAIPGYIAIPAVFAEHSTLQE